MGRGRGWTADEIAEMASLRARKAGWEEIATATGHSIEACKNRAAHRNARKRWSADDEAKLIRLREVDRLSWYEIDSHFGREHGSCSHKYAALKDGAPPPAKPKPADKIVHPHWSEADMALAQAHWRALFVDVYGGSAPRDARRLVFESIGAALQRTPTAVENRLRLYGASFGLNPASKPLERPVEVSQAMIERDARKRAEACRSITANFFGDPPPGYSALDQRRQACTGAPRDNR